MEGRGGEGGRAGGAASTPTRPGAVVVPPSQPHSSLMAQGCGAASERGVRAEGVICSADLLP